MQAFNGHTDSGAARFLTIENDVNGFACHCCETINRSVIMVGKLLIFFFFLSGIWYAQHNEEMN